MATPQNGIYVLQGIVPSQIAAAPVGVKVVDLYDDNGQLFTSSQVAQMESGGGQVLGYFSIGEAENYRSYFSSLPSSALGPVDPSWPGDYQVAYWTSAWKTVATNYIDQMIAQGYNGAYFDVVDEAEKSWAKANAPGGDPIGAMESLVESLASYAHAKNPNFKIWINSSGAEDMLANSAFVNAIDGAYEEELFYQDSGAPQPAADVNYNLSLLHNVTAAGKSVVAIEYVTGGTKVGDVHAKAAAAGVGSYIANPNLELNGVDTEGFASLAPPTTTSSTAAFAQYVAAKSSYDQISGGFAISDTSANITANLNQLLDPKINTITISDNGSIGSLVAQLTSDAAAIGKLKNANGTPYQLAISDSAATIVGQLSALNSNTHVTSVKVTSGAATLSGGAVVSAKAFGLTGSTTVLTIAENLAYSGNLSTGTRSTLSIASGDTLTLKGASTLAGTVSGAGTLALAGGSTTITSGAKLSIANWSISGAGTNATLGEALGAYSGAFSEGAGSTLNLTGGTLTLLGSAKFARGTVKGSNTINTEGATTVSGLTIGGTVTWNNTKTVIQSGGNVTIGDSSGAAARLVVATTGTYDITGNSGIGRGSSTASSISNGGLFEKTGGTGTSAITPNIANAHTIAVSSGTLDLRGAVSGTGNLQIGGGSSLQLDGAVGAGQTVAFAPTGGNLKLNDLYSRGSQLFHGTVSGFGAGDSIDAGAPFGTGTTFTYTKNSAGTGGVLALTDGSMHASINLLGNYTRANFVAQSDLHGGTLFTFHP